MRSNNIRDIEHYVEQLNRNLLPKSESMRISHGERQREYIFLGLRKTAGISITGAMDLGMDIPGAALELIKAGFLEMVGDSLRFTRRGRVIANTVIVALFGKLGL
jgi:oxygen-independent coproporphyrinogen-3 oxidase